MGEPIVQYNMGGKSYNLTPSQIRLYETRGVDISEYSKINDQRTAAARAAAATKPVPYSTGQSIAPPKDVMTGQSKKPTADELLKQALSQEANRQAGVNSPAAINNAGIVSSPAQQFKQVELSPARAYAAGLISDVERRQAEGNKSTILISKGGYEQAQLLTKKYNSLGVQVPPGRRAMERYINLEGLEYKRQYLTESNIARADSDIQKNLYGPFGPAIGWLDSASMVLTKPFEPLRESGGPIGKFAYGVVTTPAGFLQTPKFLMDLGRGPERAAAEFASNAISNPLEFSGSLLGAWIMGKAGGPIKKVAGEFEPYKIKALRDFVKQPEKFYEATYLNSINDMDITLSKARYGKGPAQLKGNMDINYFDITKPSQRFNAVPAKDFLKPQDMMTAKNLLMEVNKKTATVNILRDELKVPNITKKITKEPPATKPVDMVNLMDVGTRDRFFNVKTKKGSFNARIRDTLSVPVDMDEFMRKMTRFKGKMSKNPMDFSEALNDRPPVSPGAGARAENFAKMNAGTFNQITEMSEKQFKRIESTPVMIDLKVLERPVKKAPRVIDNGPKDLLPDFPWAMPAFPGIKKGADIWNRSGAMRNNPIDLNFMDMSTAKRPSGPPRPRRPSPTPRLNEDQLLGISSTFKPAQNMKQAMKNSQNMKIRDNFRVKDIMKDSEIMRVGQPQKFFLRFRERQRQKFKEQIKQDLNPVFDTGLEPGTKKGRTIRPNTISDMFRLSKITGGKKKKFSAQGYEPSMGAILLDIYSNEPVAATGIEPFRPLLK